jgi:hypothetical protein
MAEQMEAPPRRFYDLFAAFEGMAVVRKIPKMVSVYTWKGADGVQDLLARMGNGFDLAEATASINSDFGKLVLITMYLVRAESHFVAVTREQFMAYAERAAATPMMIESKMRNWTRKAYDILLLMQAVGIFTAEDAPVKRRMDVRHLWTPHRALAQYGTPKKIQAPPPPPPPPPAMVRVAFTDIPPLAVELRPRTTNKRLVYSESSDEEEQQKRNKRDDYRHSTGRPIRFLHHHQHEDDNNNNDTFTASADQLPPLFVWGDGFDPILH